MMSRNVLYSLIALLTVTFWGLTFVSTKILILCGLTPAWIFIIRFAIAYLCMVAICHKKLWSDSRRDELCMAVMGLTGGSLYYIAENTALQWSYASNVSMIVCGATPVMTILLCAVFDNQKISARTIVGSALALSGVAMVMSDGTFSFGLSPKGDILALFAALLWAVYCLLLKRMSGRYSNLFITRKVFFYGCVTGLAWSLFEERPCMPAEGSIVTVIINLLFLGVVASFICYIMWGDVVKVLGPDHAANYIYFNPLVTVIASMLLLGEPITLWLVIGGIMTVAGVWMTSR